MHTPPCHHCWLWRGQLASGGAPLPVGFQLWRRCVARGDFEWWRGSWRRRGPDRAQSSLAADGSGVESPEGTLAHLIVAFGVLQIPLLRWNCVGGPRDGSAGIPGHPAPRTRSRWPGEETQVRGFQASEAPLGGSSWRSESR